MEKIKRLLILSGLFLIILYVRPPGLMCLGGTLCFLPPCVGCTSSSRNAGQTKTQIARTRDDILGIVETVFAIRVGSRNGIDDVLVAHAAIHSQGIDLHLRTGRSHAPNVFGRDDEVQGDDRPDELELLLAVLRQRLDDGATGGTHGVGNEENAIMQVAVLLVADFRAGDLVVLVGRATGTEIIHLDLARKQHRGQFVHAGGRRNVASTQQIGDCHLCGRIERAGRQHGAATHKTTHRSHDGSRSGWKEVVDDFPQESLSVEPSCQLADIGEGGLLVAQLGEQRCRPQAVQDVDAGAVEVFYFTHLETSCRSCTKKPEAFANGSSERNCVDFIKLFVFCQQGKSVFILFIKFPFLATT